MENIQVELNSSFFMIKNIQETYKIVYRITYKIKQLVKIKCIINHNSLKTVFYVIIYMVIYMQIVLDDEVIDVVIERKRIKNIYFRFKDNKLHVTCHKLIPEIEIKRVIKQNEASLIKMKNKVERKNE